VADDLYENSVVSDVTWAVLSKKYSTEQLMDASSTVGQYNLYRGPPTASACRSTISCRAPKVGSLPALVQGRAPSDHPPNRSPESPREKAMNVATRR